MSSRLKSKKLRVIIALILIFLIIGVAAYGYYENRLRQGRQLSVSVPRPPLVHGCHEYSKSQGWRTIECLSPEFVREHIPHPRVHISPLAQGGMDGVLGINQTRPDPVYAVTSASVMVNVMFNLPQTCLNFFGSSFCLSSTETDSVWGPGVYSIQLNTNTFTGRNGHTYWYQFAAQNLNPSASPAYGSFNINTCSSTTCKVNLFGIQEIDLTAVCQTRVSGQCTGNAGYYCMCLQIPPQPLTSSSIAIIQAFVIATGTAYGSLISTVSFPSTGNVFAVVTNDLYGLSVLGHWQSVDGTILGGGNGSQAQFPTPTIISTTLTAKYGDPGRSARDQEIELNRLLPNSQYIANTAETNNLSGPYNLQMAYGNDGTVTLQSLTWV